MLLSYAIYWVAVKEIKLISKVPLKTQENNSDTTVFAIYPYTMLPETMFLNSYSEGSTPNLPCINP